ncbi:MAG: sigma-70 family RNA polymerase sigma factor [Oscillospiraceae bacterium]|nr:sigma-70 family RNA polymerase sigma factor [Oscillospiraceae bacterium]
MFDTEKTIKLFSEQYYEKLFYFSLKKTGNRTEAEDLTSDIILDIITALRKGIIPEYFSAYVWKIARSRFFKWAEKKSKSRKYLDANSFDDLSEFNLPDENSKIEENYIKKEDINVLRREISLISKDYREILVSFYIDDKKISQISKEFNLPEGTIKTKLFKSRKILQEGMKMAREFGIKSYKPEDVSFIKSGMDGTDGSPWSKLKTKLAKNILLEAYHNPSTIEELSLELGVAAPYMEEAVEELLDATLLKKLESGKNKYQTDFRIFNAEEQREEENRHLKIKDEYFELVKEIISVVEKEGNKDLLGGTQTFEELKWLYLLDLTDGIYCHVERKIPVEKVKPVESFTPFTGYTQRPYGGQWDICGYEEFTKCEYATFIGYDGCGSYENNSVRSYNFDQHDWGERPTNSGLNDEMTRVTSQILDGTVDENKDKKIINQLLDFGVFEIKDGKYICKMAIVERFETLLSQSVNEDIYKNKILPLCDKLDKLRANMFIRPYVFSTALKAGYITIPEDFSRSMIGISLWR